MGVFKILELNTPPLMDLFAILLGLQIDPLEVEYLTQESCKLPSLFRKMNNIYLMLGGRKWGFVFGLIGFMVEVSLALYPHYITITLYWIFNLPNQVVTLADWWSDMDIKLPHLSKLLMYWGFEWSHISLLSLIPLVFFTFGFFGMFFWIGSGYGYDQGHDIGYDQGHDIGYDQGYDQGCDYCSAS